MDIGQQEIPAVPAGARIVVGARPSCEAAQQAS